MTKTYVICSHKALMKILWERYDCKFIFSFNVGEKGYHMSRGCDMANITFVDAWLSHSLASLVREITSINSCDIGPYHTPRHVITL